VIWDVNSFDQWGVQLGKVLASRILNALQAETAPAPEHDGAVNAWIRYFRRNRDARLPGNA
jgi:glucose-6-phosphate isomerase